MSQQAEDFQVNDSRKNGHLQCRTYSNICFLCKYIKSINKINYE